MRVCGFVGFLSFKSCLGHLDIWVRCWNWTIPPPVRVIRSNDNGIQEQGWGGQYFMRHPACSGQVYRSPSKGPWGSQARSWIIWRNLWFGQFRQFPSAGPGIGISGWEGGGLSTGQQRTSTDRMVGTWGFGDENTYVVFQICLYLIAFVIFNKVNFDIRRVSNGHPLIGSWWELGVLPMRILMHKCCILDMFIFHCFCQIQ